MKLLKHNAIPIFISFLIVGLILTVLFMLKGLLLQLIGAALIIVAAVFCIFCGLYLFGYIVLGVIGIVTPIIGLLLIIGIFIWIF
ncbi:hypothetical protein P2R64_23815 [Priestia megaterium]|uniref:hypothetical protein n=1 Tax=Priestia megaterium TaxID=1404 RepID=UPI0021C0687C|nr:hypothetical protein [Priestia megaterium]MCT9852328.1 hypothetical protein [Priestia megaterium]MDF1963082.1 hypothetical protein [Priestia megaterium]